MILFRRLAWQVVPVGLALLVSADLMARQGASSATPQFSPGLFKELRWRNIGPMRGGRTKAAIGVPSQPGTFYIGVCNGGVWKTTDYGRTWVPLFDEQPTGSIGDIAVSLSNPDMVYVASGEGLQRPDLSTGDGIYKSTDAGKTWTHLGLRDGQQIPRIIVDPHNPDRVFVAVLGHPYGPNTERGIFRSLDGGKTFEKVLYKDENTGGADVEFDPWDSDTVYATLWEARQGPWENAAWPGTNGGIFKSTDGGKTWRPLTKGLPPEGVVQADVAIAPSDHLRIYASVASPRGVGIFRSDDAGETWTRATTDGRPAGRIGGGDLPVPVVNPKNADIVIMASTVSWKSVDGGKTWLAFRGAPGGDDYQRAWIDPNNPDVILIAADQGAVITVNGGKSWSSWYNQSTAQLYHVAADNAFPYRLCSGQQESGSACVASRGDWGQITVREWSTVGVDEYGYAAPDPLDPNVVYGGRGPTRFDRRTGQVQNIAPSAVRQPDFRTVRTVPVVFSKADPRVLFYAGNTMWKTANGGQSWTKISPDLSRKTWEVPATVGKYRDTDAAKPAQRGVIYTVAPSPRDINVIWAGTDDGLIHVTVDGGLHWKDVTPPDLKPWAKVSLIDASPFDPLVAYAAVNTLRLDDMRPHIYRTRDGGKTWTHITAGIPDGGTVNVVREDPKRKGLLFAGTEQTVFVSFDDGERWQSLRQNLAASSVRDLIVKDDDLAVATHGRGFWILDDISPLRQMDAQTEQTPALLFKPQTAVRVRWNMNTDTPLPPDEPTLPNPPDGAVINYYLKANAAGPVTMEIVDGTGKIIRRYTSTDPVDPVDPATFAVPLYWVRPPQVLAASAGLHRFVWDLHYQPLTAGGGGRGGLPIAAVPYNTVAPPVSLWVAPGTYTVKLTVDGKSYTQPINVRMDPRVKTSALGLQQQATLSMQMYDGVLAAQAAVEQLRALRTQLEALAGKAGDAAVKEAIEAFQQKVVALGGGAALAGPGGPGGPGGGGGGGGRGGEGGGAAESLANIGGPLTQMMAALQSADVAPTSQLVAAVGARQASLTKLLAQWTALKTMELGVLNAKLKAANLGPLNVPVAK